MHAVLLRRAQAGRPRLKSYEAPLVTCVCRHRRQVRQFMVLRQAQDKRAISDCLPASPQSSQLDHDPVTEPRDCRNGRDRTGIGVSGGQLCGRRLWRLGGSACPSARSARGSALVVPTATLSSLETGFQRARSAVAVVATSNKPKEQRPTSRPPYVPALAMSRPRVFLLEDEAALVSILLQLFELEGVDATLCSSTMELQQRIAQDPQRVVVADSWIRSVSQELSEDEREAIEALGRLAGGVILTTARAWAVRAHPTFSSNVIVMPKPYELDCLVESIRAAWAGARRRSLKTDWRHTTRATRAACARSHARTRRRRRD